MSTCEITSQGIGKIFLTDTKESVLKRIPTVKFENAADGEGVEWLIATYEGITILIPEDGFSYLQVEDGMCKTKAGAAVGINVAQLEKIYGKALKVESNDANAEEEVIFEKASKNISFKGYDLGNFQESQPDSHTTKKINLNGTVGIISVSAGK